MIPYEGGRNRVGMYTPLKLQKWGYKSWCLDDRKTRYCASFLVYVGRRGNDDEKGVEGCGGV